MIVQSTVSRAATAGVFLAAATAMTPAISSRAFATSDSQVSVAPDSSGTTARDGVIAYRAYVRAQADLLVGMTKVLATEIRDGNVEAAQSAYAPAHGYLARLAVIAKLQGDLEARMDAFAEDHDGKASDPAFSGFHRLEYGLFVNRSTAGLSETANQLLDDARVLRDRIAHSEIDSTLLVERATRLVEDIAARKLTGDEERYAKSDLWDLEANIAGVREIVALARTKISARDDAHLAHLTLRFAEIDALLARHKEGCGFKSYDALTPQDRLAFKPPLVGLAQALSTLRAKLAMD